MDLYRCQSNPDGTGFIKEQIAYPYKPAGYCILKKYEILYREELPRFGKNPLRVYALPYEDSPVQAYRGIGCQGTGEFLPMHKQVLLSKEDRKLFKTYQEYRIEDYSLFDHQKDALRYQSFLKNKDDYIVAWVRIHGCETKPPEQYELLGYDISYPPEMQGSFSCICDCMFICQWHGCDPEGTLFLAHFNLLNQNGLFDTADVALDYLAAYIEPEWSERGEFCICEIFGKHTLD